MPKGTEELTAELPGQKQVCDGTEKKPAITVKDKERILTEGTDYTVVYIDSLHAGTLKITITGKGSYTGEKEVAFMIEKAKLSRGQLTQSSLVFTGKPQSAEIRRRYPKQWNRSPGSWIRKAIMFPSALP